MACWDRIIRMVVCGYIAAPSVTPNAGGAVTATVAGCWFVLAMHAFVPRAVTTVQGSTFGLCRWLCVGFLWADGVKQLKRGGCFSWFVMQRP